MGNQVGQPGTLPSAVDGYTSGVVRLFDISALGYFDRCALVDLVPLEVARPAGGNPARNDSLLCQVSPPGSVVKAVPSPTSPVLRYTDVDSSPSGLAAMDQSLPWSASLPVGETAYSPLLPAPLTPRRMVEELAATLQLQHDAGLILSNVQVLQQFVTSLRSHACHLRSGAIPCGCYAAGGAVLPCSSGGHGIVAAT